MKPGSYGYVPIERVHWDKPAAEAVTSERTRSGAQRVFTVASKTLSRKTDVIAQIRAALGSHDVGLFDECREHTPLESVIACAEAARDAKPDLILTVGGGTPIDTVKLVQLCLTHGIRSTEALQALAGKATATPSVLRQIIVPTTLSGGEYSTFAGGTDVAREGQKLYHGPDLCGRAIILDPTIALHTPQWLWLSTAIRALDHAVEGYSAPGTNALIQATALHAIKLFASSLPRTKAQPGDLRARHDLQMATWLAATSLGRVSMGASHGIGYLLGTMYGVPHGYTSCVMLPAVLRWNEPVTGELQKDIAAALGRPGELASEVLTALIDELGLPHRLGDVGIAADQIPAIAARAAEHPVVRGNPRPVRDANDAAAILQLAL